MIDFFNRYFNNYWIANSKLSLFKISIIILFLFLLGSIFAIVFHQIYFFYIFLIIILVFIISSFNKILKYGYNRKIFEDKELNFLVYDNKKPLNRFNDTRILRINDSDFSSRVWLSVSKNIKKSAYLSELIDLIPSKLLTKKNHILHLGGCANSIPLFLAVNYSKLINDVVEIDKHFSDVSKKYFYPLFGKNDFKKINHFNADAKEFVKINEKKYSVIIQDIFISNQVPKYFLSATWIKNIIRSLKKDGMVLINLRTPSSEEVFEILMNLPKKLHYKKLIGIKNYSGFVCLYLYKIN